MMVRRCQFVLKALPVWTADRRLRLLRWKDGKAKLEPLPNLPDVPMEDAFIGQGAGTETVFLRFTEAKMFGCSSCRHKVSGSLPLGLQDCALLTLPTLTGMAFWMPFGSLASR
jgi:hypothetical protein